MHRSYGRLSAGFGLNFASQDAASTNSALAAVEGAASNGRLAPSLSISHHSVYSLPQRCTVHQDDGKIIFRWLCQSQDLTASDLTLATETMCIPTTCCTLKALKESAQLLLGAVYRASISAIYAEVAAIAAVTPAVVSGFDQLGFDYSF